MFITNLFTKFHYKDLVTLTKFYVAALAIDFSLFYIK